MLNRIENKLVSPAQHLRFFTLTWVVEVWKEREREKIVG